MELSPADWTRIYKEMLVLANRLTFTKVDRLKGNARDRAQEAVQRAWDRYLEVDPLDVRDLDALRSYLSGAVRSTLGHVGERAAARRTAEDAATVERGAVEGNAAKSPEELHLEAGQRLRDKGWATRKVRRLRAELKGDRLALATLDCVADGHDSPEEQARILGCKVEDIYNARKRRLRAMDRVREAMASEDDDEALEEGRQVPEEDDPDDDPGDEEEP